MATLVFVVSVPLVAAALFVPVLILAGPHSSLLPSAIQPVVLGLGWLCVVAIPFWLASRVFRRLERSRHAPRH